MHILSSSELDWSLQGDLHSREFRDNFKLDDLPHRRLRAMYEYWCQKRIGPALPPVSAIDPLTMPRQALPWLVLVDVLGNPPRLRFRLQGTQVVDAAGADYSSRYFDEVPGMEQQIERIAWCVSSARPYLVETQLTWSSRKYRTYSCLTLPFGGESTGVTRVVGVFAFSEPLQPEIYE